MVVVCAGGENFCLFLIVFVPLSCFKLVSFRKAIMGCKLLKTSLISPCVCLLFLLYLEALGRMLMKMILCLYVWVYK